VGYLSSKLSSLSLSKSDGFDRLNSNLCVWIKAEGTAAFSEFHLYVCLAFLVRYSDQLRAMDFQVKLSPLN